MEEYNYIKRYKTIPLNDFIQILKHGTITGLMTLSPDKKFYYINRGSYLEKVHSINIEKAYPPYLTINKEKFLEKHFNQLRKDKIDKLLVNVNKIGCKL
jgi:hypothetical protein